MKLICHKPGLFICSMMMQILFLSSCSKKSYNEKIGFSGFYLDMNYTKVQRTMDSLLKAGDLNYYETADLMGNKQKNLYSNFSEISPALYAKVNLRGAYIIDEKLVSIQLTLCSRIQTGDQRFLFNCALGDLNKTFDVYKKKYGKPELLGQGEEYDWLSKRISNVYLPGPKGRLNLDKIYFWDKGNYIIYFDFGYPLNPDNPKKSDVAQGDSTSAPIIYYGFSEAYTGKILDKAGG